MTDVEEPTANIDPTIDAECPVQLAERGIVWVCAPRIEEGWEEVQSVRKAAGVGVGECGVAPRKKASIDEALHGGNQGVVRNDEVCFAVTLPDSLLRLLALGWLVGVACFATTPTGLLGCHFHVRPSSWTRCGIDSLHTFGSCCILYIIRSPFLHLSEDVQIMSSGLIATTSSPPSHCRLKTSRLSPKWSSQVRGTSKRACPSHVERTNRRNVTTPLTLSTQDPKTLTKWSSQVRGTSKRACPGQTASTPTPPSPTTHPRPRKTHHLRTPSHIPSSTPSPSPSSTTPITPPLTPPPTDHRPTRRRSPFPKGQAKKGAALARGAAKPPPEAAVVKSLPALRDADHRVPRPRRVRVVRRQVVPALRSGAVAGGARVFGAEGGDAEGGCGEAAGGHGEGGWGVLDFVGRDVVLDFTERDVVFCIPGLCLGYTSVT